MDLSLPPRVPVARAQGQAQVSEELAPVALEQERDPARADLDRTQVLERGLALDPAREVPEQEVPEQEVQGLEELDRAVEPQGPAQELPVVLEQVRVQTQVQDAAAQERGQSNLD